MTPLETLIAELHAFVRERDWEQFHDPKNLAMALGSEVGELMAELRWVRSENLDAHVADETNRARLAAELGDVGILLFLLADRMDMDLLEAMRTKLEQNRRKYPVDASRGRADRPGEQS
jgi:NTP pyrophosphatase (non-canonical NTP hydrolase)